MRPKLAKLDPIAAAAPDRRRDSRRSVYRNEGLTVRIKDGDLSLLGDIVDLGSEGVGVFVETDLAGVLARLRPGVVVELALEVPGVSGKDLRGIVANASQTTIGGRGGVRLGIAYLTTERTDGHAGDERVVSRFKCRPRFAPTAYCEHPLFFQECIFFEAVDFSPGGVKLTTSARNQSLMVGMNLPLTFSIPMGGEFQVPGDVAFVRPAPRGAGGGGGDRLEVGVRFVETSREFLAAISEYLFAATDCSLDALRKAGFAVERIERGLNFGYPTSAEDWRSILRLRYRAYTAVGKFADAKSEDDLLDEFDGYARQVICKVHGKIIACGRVVFVNGEKHRSEHHRLGVEVPAWLWGERFCEFSRACTDDDYRGSDVFINLLRQFGRVAYQGGCRYVLANCNDNMWPMYRSTGFKKLGVTFSAFSAARCHLIAVNIEDMLSGRSGRLVGWNQVVYPMASFLSRRFDPTLIPAWRAKLHRRLFPVLRRVRQMRRKPRQRPAPVPAKPQ